MILIDSHCHLNLFQDQEDLKSVVERSLNAGVTKIIVPGVDVTTSISAIDIADKFPSVFASVGIHPNEAAKSNERDRQTIEEMASHKKVVAIGEIGLDYHYSGFDKAKQVEILHSMLEIASGCGKPIILHSRDAMDDLLHTIQSWEASKSRKRQNQLGWGGVFHSFEGNVVQAECLQDLHYAIGIGGPVTFINNSKLHALVRQIGIKNLVLETDSPYLSPHPYRGKRNEPSRIPVIAQKVADLLEIQVELVAEKTTLTANQLFKME